jgi:hypothetical protein
MICSSSSSSFFFYLFFVLFKKNCPQNYAKLVQRCWHQTPSKRPLSETLPETLEEIASSTQDFDDKKRIE